MRIAWIHSFPPQKVSSGIFMSQLLEELKKNDQKIDLVYTGRIRTITDYFSVRRILERKVKGYDLIHSQYGSGCGFIVSGLTHKKKVLTLRGSDLYGCPNGSIKNKLHGMLSRKLSFLSIRKYDYIIVMSNEMKKIVKRNFYKNSDLQRPIEIIPDGINMKMFQPMDRSKARDMIGHGNDNSQWILFSTLNASNPIKRVNLAKKAFYIAKEKFPNLKMKVLTGIPHDKVPFYINASDVILLTSVHEGWPNIIKEGLSCNVPFVSTDVSDLRTIALDAANCFVEDADPQKLADSLIESLKIGKVVNLRQFVEFSEMKKIAKRLIALYQEI